MISSNHYHSEDHSSLEMDKIFNDNWLFVGTHSELGNNNDFVTLDIGKFAIVVQNFRGSVRAYKNICNHRFNKIQSDRKGNRPLFCIYHGWAYMPDGKPIVSKKFREDITEMGCLKLDEYVVEKCGIFYFIKLTENQVSLNDFLGDYYTILNEYSETIGKEVYNQIMPHKANWKLLVENVLECYHCKTVHTKTFIPMGIGTALPINFRFSNKHNDCEYPKVENEKLDIKAKKLAFLNYRLKKHDSYHHIFIYPNLFISSTEGNLFYIGNFIPTSVDETILNVRFHSPKFEIPEGEKVSQAFMEAFFEASAQSGLTVLNEDKMILENIQSVISKVNRKPIFGKEEFRIEKFYETYFADLK